MRKRLILFACIASLALSTCENPQVIELLRSPTELAFLDVVAYADDFPLTGGASLEPTLRPGVFEYTVYVAKDATRFSIDAGIGAAGSVVIYSEEDERTGTAFDFAGEPKVITVTVQREYMRKSEYRLSVQLLEEVPTAKGVKISLTPGIGTFFIGRGVLPVIEVTANLPPEGGELTYQWYMNLENNTITGFQLSGATGTSYTMKLGETMEVRTIYYYVEITNTIDGKTSLTQSPTCAVTFIDKNQLHYKSLAMSDVPAGYVRASSLNDNPDSNVSSTDTWRYVFGYEVRWDTPGFSMGSYPVTWELWRTVYERADAANYRFSRSGNQGGEERGNTNTNELPYPVGNEVHPVTLIGWRDAVVWCNAYSEMDGLEPVYKDSNGNVIRDSRMPVDLMVDATEMTGNGYRLPTAEEWFYAAKGANPVYDEDTEEPWYWDYSGTDDDAQAYRYLWNYSPDVAASGNRRTGEVGSLLPVVLPNGEELYDMLGMVYQWVWRPNADGTGQRDDETHAFGGDFTLGSILSLGTNACMTSMAPFNADWGYLGLRLARNGGE
jgi:formylglycine-generating enzyme required for sulfatase activity